MKMAALKKKTLYFEIIVWCPRRYHFCEKLSLLQSNITGDVIPRDFQKEAEILCKCERIARFDVSLLLYRTANPTKVTSGLRVAEL